MTSFTYDYGAQKKDRASVTPEEVAELCDCAADLLERPDVRWVKGVQEVYLGRNDLGRPQTGFCALGALWYAVKNDHTARRRQVHHRQAILDVTVFTLCVALGGTKVETWNDHVAAGEQMVLDLFRKTAKEVLTGERELVRARPPTHFRHVQINKPVMVDYAAIESRIVECLDIGDRVQSLKALYTSGHLRVRTAQEVAADIIKGSIA